jgi:hypothetical protein
MSLKSNRICFVCLSESQPYLRKHKPTHEEQVDQELASCSTMQPVLRRRRSQRATAGKQSNWFDSYSSITTKQHRVRKQILKTKKIDEVHSTSETVSLTPTCQAEQHQADQASTMQVGVVNPRKHFKSKNDFNLFLLLFAFLKVNKGNAHIYIFQYFHN